MFKTLVNRYLFLDLDHTLWDFEKKFLCTYGFKKILTEKFQLGY